MDVLDLFSNIINRIYLLLNFGFTDKDRFKYLFYILQHEIISHFHWRYDVIKLFRIASLSGSFSIFLLNQIWIINSYLKYRNNSYVVIIRSETLDNRKFKAFTPLQRRCWLYYSGRDLPISNSSTTKRPIYVIFCCFQYWLFPWSFFFCFMMCLAFSISNAFQFECSNSFKVLVA